MKPLLYFLLLTLFSTGRVYAVSSSKKIELLESIIYKNLTFNQSIHPDSIIRWGEEVEPILLKNKLYKELFEIKSLVAQTHAMRGDISLAIDKVQLMSDEAKSLNYELGFALAIQSIGDTYMYSNMRSEAISSYKQALDIFSRLSDTDVFKKRLLVQLLKALSSEDNVEEIYHYLNQLDSLVSDSATNDPVYIYKCLFTAYYNIKLGQLTEAKAILNEVPKLINANEDKSSLTHYHYVSAQYYEQTDEYEQALAEYKKISDTLFSGFTPIGQDHTIMNSANLLVKMNRADEACLLYQQISHIKDSLSGNSYARQINRLHANYQVDTMLIENQAQKNDLVRFAIIVVGCIFTLSVLLTLYIRRSNRRLAESKIHLEKVKKQAESSVRSKSMFLSNMSHEIRTPLNALSGFSAILTEDSIDNDTRLQCTEIIQQNSELLLKLINDVIDLSSLEFGKMQFKFEECDAIVLCRNVVDMVEKIKQTHADILFRTSLDTLTLYTDDARLQQVLINLLINATKFTPSGNITLELSLQKEDIALFTVTDTGCGIPPENQKKIFKRFEKLDEQDQGTGLGLSICQLIIEHIGGKIWIDPDYTEGARFCFTHPINKQKQ